MATYRFEKHDDLLILYAMYDDGKVFELRRRLTPLDEIEEKLKEMEDFIQANRKDLVT